MLIPKKLNQEYILILPQNLFTILYFWACPSYGSLCDVRTGWQSCETQVPAEYFNGIEAGPLVLSSSIVNPKQAFSIDKRARIRKSRATRYLTWITQFHSSTNHSLSLIYEASNLMRNNLHLICSCTRGIFLSKILEERTVISAIRFFLIRVSLVDLFHESWCWHANWWKVVPSPERK